MKKIVCLLAVMALMGCSQAENSSVSNNSDISSINVSTSYSETEKIQMFLDYLLSLEGEVCSSNQKITATDYYLTDSMPLEMTIKQESTTTRYSNDNSNLVIEEGKIGIADGDNVEYDNYKMQKSRDNEYLYQITDYEGSQDELKTYTRSATDYLFFNIGFPLSEYENIIFMIQNYEDKHYGLEYENLDARIRNGTWEYKYSVTFWETEENKITSVPHEKHVYNNKLIINNGIITSLTQDVSHEFYYGGLKANWSEYHIERIYNQGKKEDFKGTLLDPKNYNVSK